jgi:hypothetical protein
MELKRKRIEASNKFEIAQHYLNHKDNKSQEITDIFNAKPHTWILDRVENIAGPIRMFKKINEIVC